MSLLNVSTSLNASELGAALSEGGGVNVDLDASLLVQIGLFVVLLVILKPLLFDPMLKLFDEREKQTDGIRAKARKLDKKSAEDLAKYENILAKAREEGAAERDSIRAEGTRKEAEMMARVRATIAQTIEQGRATTASEAKTARAALGNEAQALGRAIATRIVGREVSS
jgi:F-type H+-transporting ATPase subunit b